MNRRSFLQLLGFGAIGATVAKTIPTQPWDEIPVKLRIPDAYSPIGLPNTTFRVIIDPNCPPDQMFLMSKDLFPSHSTAKHFGVIKNLG